MVSIASHRYAIMLSTSSVSDANRFFSDISNDDDDDDDDDGDGGGGGSCAVYVGCNDECISNVHDE